MTDFCGCIKSSFLNQTLRPKTSSRQSGIFIIVHYSRYSYDKRDKLMSKLMSVIPDRLQDCLLSLSLDSMLTGWQHKMTK